jgi:hypothetical protein
MDIFGFEIEAQFGFLSVRANKKSQVKSQGRCGYNVASRHSLILLLPGLKCVVDAPRFTVAGFSLRRQCGHIVLKGRISVNEEDANEGSQGTENANDQNQG